MKIEIEPEFYQVIGDFYFKERKYFPAHKTLEEFIEFCMKHGFLKMMELVDLQKAGAYIRMGRPEVLAKMKEQGLIPAKSP